LAFLTAPVSSGCLGATGALSAIPLVAANSKKERIAATLVMPFIAIGLVGSIALYFAMFRFAWFAAVFNIPGFGPLGVIIFGLSASLVSGWHGYRCVRRKGGFQMAKRARLTT
jgi:hypothetical protein